MYLLDTDHISLIQRGGAEGGRISRRLTAVSSSDVFLSIVSFEEQTRGWLAEIAKSPSISKQQIAYHKLAQMQEIYCENSLLLFGNAAVETFQRLWLLRLRVGTMDLKIAAIAIANNATLLSRNLSDFGKIPDLRVEDWSL